MLTLHLTVTRPLLEVLGAETLLPGCDHMPRPHWGCGSAPSFDSHTHCADNSPGCDSGTLALTVLLSTSSLSACDLAPAPLRRHLTLDPTIPDPLPPCCDSPLTSYEPGPSLSPLPARLTPPSVLPLP